MSAAIVALVLMGGCVPGPNPLVGQTGVRQSLAGFLLGLWHGVIIWVTFVVSLFDRNVSVYEVCNNGWPYNLGFVLGAASFHGGAVTATRR